MRITETKLAGTLINQNMPRTIAIISRPLEAANITVTIIQPDSERQHLVDPDCAEDAWSMAECLQYHLDGTTGTNSDIQAYYRLLEQFMN